MMKLKFEKVTSENWKECIDLKVHPDQTAFVASNAYSLVQAQYIKGLYPLCIFDGEKMVGFAMWEEDPDDHSLAMCRLMIDKRYQKRGYGRAAVVKLMDLIRDQYGHVPFYTSFEPENTVAGDLYMSLGFEKTGELLGEEIILKINL